MAAQEWDWFQREELIGQISDIRVQNLQGTAAPASPEGQSSPSVGPAASRVRPGADVAGLRRACRAQGVGRCVGVCVCARECVCARARVHPIPSSGPSPPPPASGS